MAKETFLANCETLFDSDKKEQMKELQWTTKTEEIVLPLC
jgi:hypothetical protein